MAVLAPHDVEGPAVELDGSAAVRESPPVCGDESGAGTAAAGRGDPGAPLPDAQPNMAAVADRGDANVGAFRKQRITFEGRPEHSEIDTLDMVYEKRRMGVADIGADRIGKRPNRQLDMVGIHGTGERDLAPAATCRPHIDSNAPIRQDLRFEEASDGLDPRVRVAGLAIQEVANAACGVAAGFGLAAVGIADAHQNAGRGMTRRFEKDHLVASDAGAPIGKRAYAPRADGYRGTAKIEHDKVVAEPVHLEKRDLAHRAAYMAARRVLSNAEALGASRQASFAWVTATRAWRAPALPCFAVALFVAPGVMLFDPLRAPAALTDFSTEALPAALACAGEW